MPRHDWKSPSFDRAALEAIDAIYNGASAASTGGGQRKKLPDGRYIFTVEECRIGETKAGDPMLRFVFVVDSGEYEGLKAFVSYNITEKGIPFLKRDMMAILRCDEDELPRMSAILTKGSTRERFLDQRFWADYSSEPSQDGKRRWDRCYIDDSPVDDDGDRGRDDEGYEQHLRDDAPPF